MDCYPMFQETELSSQHRALDFPHLCSFAYSRPSSSKVMKYILLFHYSECSAKKTDS